MSIKKSKAGRKPLEEKLKRNFKISFYLNEIEYDKYIKLKNRLSSSSPALSINEFFRKVIENADDGLLEYLELELNSDIRTHLKTLRAYNKQFRDMDTKFQCKKEK